MSRRTRLLVLAVVDREAGRQPERRGLAAQQPHRGGVERADPQARRRGPDGALDALAHLARGAVREREREDRLGADAALEQPRDARGEHAGLARAGAGDDQRGAALVLDGVALRGVERKRLGRLRTRGCLAYGRKDGRRTQSTRTRAGPPTRACEREGRRSSDRRPVLATRARVTSRTASRGTSAAATARRPPASRAGPTPRAAPA